MTHNTDPSPDNYRVHLVECPDLSDGERGAAELRFRMALEFALGGPDEVLPTLQAYMLVHSLNEELPLGKDSEAEEQVIALWENAETDAILAAFRPLGKDMGDARFEIVPL
ncbi:hypothetical protein [Polaromonas sp.]|uniref:hypothetical protein n=1 Tax=Polaromonas sp. TaxID=1869339 RepID=UPI0032670A44